MEAQDVGDIHVGVNTWLRFPSLATQVQRVLGAEGAAACDVSAGCSGFIYAVEAAYNRVLVEKLKYGRDVVSLVIGVDGLSHVTDWTDRSTCVLLGDGAGAVVLQERGAGRDPGDPHARRRPVRRHALPGLTAREPGRARLEQADHARAVARAPTSA